MVNWSKKPKSVDGLFVESTIPDQLRARQVWRFVVVLWLTWVFFAAFLWQRGYQPASRICLAESLLILVIIICCRKHNDYRQIMSLNLAASAVGLFAVSLSHPSMAGTMLFYPVSILVASQLFGVRAAFSWLIINLLAFLAYSLNVYGLLDLINTTRFDELVLIIGVAGCIYFCCQQGEEYYRQRTEKLIELSQNLQVKSDRLQILATTDSLTGLTNRFRFQESLQEAVEDAKMHSKFFALFVIDMDGFKEINDTLGHPVGDTVLVEIGARLSREFSSLASISRLGGDEFCIIYPNIQNDEEANSVAQRVCKLLTHRFVLQDTVFPLGASVGYSLFPDHATSDKDLLAFADTAMFHAKENRLGYSSYQREMTERLVEYRSVQEKLSLALDRNEFFLVYQPQIDMHSGEVIGVEALLRWRHNVEVISPVRFIHLLEKSREIIPVSKWIIREACRQLSVWNQQGYDVEISINVSAMQFADPDFYQSIIDPIREFGLDPKKLDFEITEGLLIDNIEETALKLRQMRELGASISIDDFGTGYSSLAYLRQFPIDRLKIDRAFVKDIPDTDDGVIAASIIVLAKSLGMKVIAEGVETEQQLMFLKSHDCDQYQGYYLSPPVSAEKVSQFFVSNAVELLV